MPPTSPTPHRLPSISRPVNVYANDGTVRPGTIIEVHDEAAGDVTVNAQVPYITREDGTSAPSVNPTTRGVYAEDPSKPGEWCWPRFKPDVMRNLAKGPNS